MRNPILLLVACLWACGVEPAPRLAAPVATAARAPALDGEGSADRADHGCTLILRSLTRVTDDEGAPLVRCHDGACSWGFAGVIDVATSALADGGAPALLFHVAEDPTWWELPATPIGPGAPGFVSFAVTIDQRLVDPTVGEEQAQAQRIELVPFLHLAAGARLFEHNRNQGALDNYWLTADNGFALMADGFTCLRRARTAALRFDAAWGESVWGTLHADGRLAVHYDLARLPRCRNTHNGHPAWDTTAFVRLLPAGEIVSGSVRAFASNMGQPTTAAHAVPFEVALPAETTAVEVWFANSSGAGSSCKTWDSNYGANYRFAVAPPPEADPCFGLATWQDRYHSSPTCPDYTIDAHHDATHCELFLDGLGDGYEGHYGIPFRWLDAYLSVPPAAGEVLGAGLWVDTFDHTDATEGWQVVFGQAVEPGVWHTGYTYLFSGYMGDGSYRRSVRAFASFVDLRRPSGEVVRLWQSRGGANYVWADAFGLPTVTEWIPYGRVEWANAGAPVFAPKRSCQ